MRRLAAFSLITLTLALAGCPAAHDGYPDPKNMSCATNDDCYQGEVCDISSLRCTAVGADMSATSNNGAEDMAQAPAGGDQ